MTYEIEEVREEKLKENKIYFETFASFSIAILGFVLTVVNIVLYIKDNHIAEKQLELSRLTNKPIFNATVTYHKEPVVEGGIKYDSNIEFAINNSGCKFQEGNLIAESMLCITAYTPHSLDEVNKVYYTILDQFINSYSSWDSEKEAFTIRSNYNYSGYMLASELRDELEKNRRFKFKVIYFQLINIQYINIEKNIVMNGIISQEMYWEVLISKMCQNINIKAVFCKMI